MLDYCTDLRIEKREDLYQPIVKTLRFDSIAIGQGVSATLKRNPRPGLIITGVNTGEAASDTKWPDGEYAHEKFFNSKAEGWWSVRERCKFSHELVLFLEGKEGGAYHQSDDCLSLPDDPSDPHTQRLIAQLSQVKWMRRENGKIQIESKANMSSRGIPSPDYADALVLTCTGSSKAEKWVNFAKINVGI
jgi:phage terminase large subunit